MASVSAWYGTFFAVARSLSEAPPRSLAPSSAGVMPSAPAAAVRPSLTTPRAARGRASRPASSPHPSPAALSIRALSRSAAALVSLPAATAASTVAIEAAFAAGVSADSSTPRFAANARRNAAQASLVAAAGDAAAGTTAAAGAVTRGEVDAATEPMTVPPARAATTRSAANPATWSLDIDMDLRRWRSRPNRSRHGQPSAGPVKKVCGNPAVFTFP